MSSTVQPPLRVRPDHDRLLRLHRPHAVVSDIHFHWTASIARDLGIPRISAPAVGLFPVCAMDSLIRNRPHLAIAGDDEGFLVPNLPDPIYMVRPEIPEFLRRKSTLGAALEDIKEAEHSSMGIVFNSFSEMESAYVDYYFKIRNTRCWFVGPVALAVNDDRKGLVDRGGGGGDPAAFDRCLTWLDGEEPRSVVYVCLGSWSRFTVEQLREMAKGLEAASRPFLWVVREEGDEWMPEGFEKRVQGKGLVVRGWAPQVAILGHTAVGSFVTHCGWNSVLEGVSAGLPMVTWPLSSEQFINEKLVVDVLRIGVKASEGFRSTAEEERVVVGAEEITRAVGRVMGGSGDEEEAEKRRRRAEKWKEKARAAVNEGGSSYEGLNELIAEIRAWHENPNVRLKDVHEFGVRREI